MIPSQQINLVGVVEDGKNPRAGLPSNPRKTIRVLAGSDLLVSILVYYRSGAPVPLNVAGSSLVLSVRKKPTDAVPIINPPRAGVVDPQVHNRATFSFLHADFRKAYFMDPGLYIYDIWLTNADASRVCLVPLSPLILEPTATTIPAT
jgi:hypothetical protein